MRNKMPNQKPKKQKKIEPGPSSFGIRKKGKIRKIKTMKRQREEKDSVRMKV